MASSMPRELFDSDTAYLEFVEKQLKVQRGSDEDRAGVMRRVDSMTLFEDDAKYLDFLDTINYNEEMTVDKLMNLHKLILQKDSPNDKAAGRVRTTEVEVSGEPMLHSDHVPDALKKFINWFNAEEKTTKNVFQFAATAHFSLCIIHPAVDGNGRLCRLLVNLILKRQGYPTIILPEGWREKYYDVFVWGNCDPFAEKIKELVDEKMKK